MEIVEINNVGVGYGIVDNNKVFVEKSAVGDIVKDGLIVKKSSRRQEVLCPYYERCGGCNLLHLSDEEYSNFKKRLCKNADIIKIGYNARRRVVFNYKDGKLGFFEKSTNTITEINNCLMLEPQINEILPKLKMLKAKVAVNMYDNGLGILLYLEQEPNTKLLNKFLDENANVIVLSYSIKNAEPFLYLQKKKPVIIFDNIEVEVSHNIFLQATKGGQNAITKIVVENLKKCKNVLDLYCGVGTYTFPLSNHTKIHSIEGMEEMVKILKNNIGTKKISYEIRDLVNRPLVYDELNKYDGIVINPPRNGAGKQCIYIAKSKIKKIVMVSCNPQTFFQDINVLVGAGYKLKQTTGIDQFYGTNHLEIVGVLEK
ncbi:MAG: class I SAM-dependent RNA methyltransferase [Rickettsiales bacterium]|nr:MAG: class I SAM-dependent RNA methyltransferase [Rickettsiales bacterium]